MSQSNLNLKQRDYSEKRNFHRMTLNKDIEITVDETGEVLPATCINLSSDGLMFRVEKEIAAGSMCTTIIQSGTEFTADLKAKLRIVRCESEGDSDQSYIIGAEMLESS